MTTALVWDHRNRTKEGQQGPVEVRVTVKRKLYHFPTGVKVHRSEFVAGRIVNCACADLLNERVALVYERVCRAVNGSLERGEAINVDKVKREVWQDVAMHADGDTLLDWIGEQVPQLPVSEGTRKHYYPLQDRLAEWGQMRRWEDVTAENLCRFDAWLHTLKKPVSDAVARTGLQTPRLSDAGIYNYHKCLKALLNRAVVFDRLERNPYDKLRGQFKRGDRENPEYLTEEEVERLRRLALPRWSTLDVARDLFIFQVFTGLAYTDAVAFDFSQYKKVRGRWQYIGRRQKTGVEYVSQLLPPAVAVLEKYGGTVPAIGNADYNHRLKEIGAKAGIQTRLHSHLARHTFATMMLAGGAKIENVSRMLGHKNVTMTQKYAKILAESVHEDFDKVSERWE